MADRKVDTARTSTLTLDASDTANLSAAYRNADSSSTRSLSKHLDYAGIESLLQQRQGLFHGRPVPRGGWTKLWQGLLPVQFVDPGMEALYQRWELVSTHTVQKSYQLLVLVLCAAIGVQQFGVAHGVLAYLALTTMAIVQAAAVIMTWRKERTNRVANAIAACEVAVLITFLVFTTVCVELSFAAQCTTLQKGNLPASHLIGCFAAMVIFAFGLNMQAVWLVATISLYSVLWIGLSIGLHNVPVLGGLLTLLGTYAVLCVIVTQARQRHSGNRMQFHMVVELSHRLQENLQAMKDLEVAHREAMHAQEKAVRATALRTIHDSLMQYTCHQLRNPLHSLRGILEQLRTRCMVGHVTDSTDVDHLQLMDHSAAQLSKVADDVLDFQQLQNGTFVHKPTVVEVHAVVNAAVGPCRDTCTARIDVEVAADTPCTILADGKRVTQMLSIGLSNAIKCASPQTTIRVVCRPMVSDSSPTPAEIKFEVWNEGEGLGTLDVPALFEPYERASSRCVRGIGLGLPISMLISRVLGGQVGLQDQGRCTVYWFTIPVVPALIMPASPNPCVSGDAAHSYSMPHTPLHPTPRASVFVHVAPEISGDCPWSYWGAARPLLALSPLRLLVVDDLRTNRRLLLAMASHLGHHVAELEDGDEIANYLHEGAHIDVLLLDIHMVRSDGRDICRFLRQQAHAFPIIAVTGNVSAADIESYVAAGFDGVLGKPFSSHHLAALLKRVC